MKDRAYLFQRQSVATTPLLWWVSVVKRYRPSPIPPAASIVLLCTLTASSLLSLLCRKVWPFKTFACQLLGCLNTIAGRLCSRGLVAEVQDYLNFCAFGEMAVRMRTLSSKTYVITDPPPPPLSRRALLRP